MKTKWSAKRAAIHVLLLSVFLFTLIQGNSKIHAQDNRNEIRVMIMTGDYNDDVLVIKTRDALVRQFDRIFEAKTFQNAIGYIKGLGEKYKIKRLVFIGHGTRNYGEGGSILWGKEHVTSATIQTIAATAYMAGDSSILDAFAENAEIIFYNCYAGRSQSFLQAAAQLFLAFSGGTVYGSSYIVLADMSVGNRSLWVLYKIGVYQKYHYILYLRQLYAGTPLPEDIQEFINFRGPSILDYKNFNKCSLPPFPQRNVQPGKVSIKGTYNNRTGECISMEAIVPSLWRSDENKWVIRYSWRWPIPKVREKDRQTWRYLNENQFSSTYVLKEGDEKKHNFLLAVRLENQFETRDSNARGARTLGTARFSPLAFSIDIDIFGDTGKKNAQIEAQAVIKEGIKIEGALWKWLTKGDIKLISKKLDKAKIRIEGKGELVAQLFSVSSDSGRAFFVGEATKTFDPSREDAKTGGESQAGTTTQDDNTQKEPPTPEKDKPGCSYKYSAWSKCDNKTKKQTRSLLSKEPVDCVEKDQPVLEQSCTPSATGAGAWVLVKEIPELKPCTKSNTTISCTISPSSGSFKSVRKLRHHQTLERAVHSGTMSWNPPPKVLIPGQKIKLNLKVSIKGTPGKHGGLIYGDGTWMTVGVHYWTIKGHQYRGGGSLHYAEIRTVINDKKLQSSNSHTKEWQVGPGRGEGVQLYLGYGGGTPAGRAWYHYIYEFKPDYHPGDEPKKVPPRNRLQVNLTAVPERPSFLGDTVEVTAQASGGKAPYASYKWSGDHAGKGAKVLFASRKAGDHQLSVTVTDAKGQTANASITIKVGALKVTISKVSPAGSKVALGAPVRFRADIQGGDKSKLEMLWEPNTEVNFDPFENSLTTTAIFPSPGTHKVWLVVYRVEGEQRITVGESQQLELEVVKPALTLTRVSPAPRIGDEVKLRVDAGPDTDPKKIDFWWEIAGNTLHAGALRDNREYTFKPKDSKPVTVTVHAKAKDGGEDLGEESLTITASPYTVTVSKPKRLGPPVRIWKQGKGLVTVEKQIAIHQNVLLKAGISPAPKNKPLRYQWTLNEDSHFAGGSTGSKVTVNRSQTGACVATVTIKDKYGNVLGSGSSTFQVTISQQQLDTALNRDKNQKQAKKLLQQARTQWSKGDLDRAIATLQEANKLDPDNQEIVKTLKSMERQKEELEAKPGSQDRFESIGQEDAPASGQQEGSSERQRKPPKGHKTKYGF